MDLVHVVGAGPGGLGKVPQNLKQNVKLVYNFLNTQFKKKF